MRRANTYKIYGRDGNKEDVIGFCFGSGHAAEQEYGIKELKEAFGIDEKHEATKVPSNVEFFKTDEMEFGLIVSDGYPDPNPNRIRTTEDLPRDLQASTWLKNDETRFAWGDYGFGIVTNDLENVKRLKELHEAVQNKDIALAYTGRELYVFMPSKCEEYYFSPNIDVVEEKSILEKEIQRYTQEEVIVNNERYLNRAAELEGRELNEREMKKIQEGKGLLGQKTSIQKESGMER